MSKSLKRISVLIAFLVFTSVLTSRAQEDETDTPPCKMRDDELRLEVLGFYQISDPSFLVPSKKPSQNHLFPAGFSRLPGVFPQEKYPLLFLELSARQKGDNAEVGIDAIYSPIPLIKDPLRRKVFERIIPVDTTVSVDEVEAIGVRRFRLRLFRPGNDFPIIRQTNAVEVLKSKTGEAAYLLCLKNASPKKITQIHFQLTGSWEHLAYLSGNGLAPGRETLVSVPAAFGGNVRPSGNKALVPSVVIDTVIFADDTYDGDENVLAIVLGERRGRILQLRRGLAIVQTHLAQTAPAVAEGLEALRTKFTKLTQEVESSMLDELLTRHPLLTENTRDALERGLARGLNDGKQEVLADVNHYIGKQNGRYSKAAYLRWLEELRAIYEKETAGA